MDDDFINYTPELIQLGYLNPIIEVILYFYDNKSKYIYICEYDKSKGELLTERALDLFAKDNKNETALYRHDTQIGFYIAIGTALGSAIITGIIAGLFNIHSTRMLINAEKQLTVTNTVTLTITNNVTPAITSSNTTNTMNH